jgi:hypothetical protein
MSKGDIHIDFKWLDHQLSHGLIGWVIRVTVMMVVLHFLIEWGVIVAVRDNVRDFLLYAVENPNAK